jgi:LmbE family N-acetylglucosaminyl deacetylase
MGRIPFKNPHDRIKLLFIGAHPDDADQRCGGTAISLLQAGHEVMFLSMTDGSAGHQEQSGIELAERRRAEADRVARFIGLTYEIFGIPDAGLEASIVNRDRLITLIRRFQPSIIITHRPNDYHTDHRNTALLVQDAAYLVCVPNVCPKVPRLSYNPVIMYAEDNFQKPQPFHPDVLVDITPVYETKIKAMAFHESQFFEWLPFIERYDVPVPKSDSNRLDWLKNFRGGSTNSNRFQPQLKALLKEKKRELPSHVEAFEACEYGGALTSENIGELFPFGISLLD